MAVKHNAGGSTSADEFVISRIVDAPRDVVFRAWTEAEHLAHWWGPKGYTMHTCKVDLRPGGVFLYGMRSPDGSDMWGKFVYREIVAPERLVFVDSFSDQNGGTTRHPMAATWPLEMLNIVTFSEVETRTAITLRGSAHNATEIERKTFRDGFKSMEMGFGGTFEQLVAYLATMQHGQSAGTTRSESIGREFILRRSFDAPRDLVFAMWTDPKHLSRWWGPRIMTAPVADMDVRPGGKYRLVLRGPDGLEYAMHGTYRELEKPERISLTCNLDGHPAEWFALLDKNLNGAKRAATFESIMTVNFSEMNGKTEVTVHSLFESEAVREAMVKMGMKDGWSESFERLDEELAKAKL